MLPLPTALHFYHSLPQFGQKELSLFVSLQNWLLSWAVNGSDNESWGAICIPLMHSRLAVFMGLLAPLHFPDCYYKSAGYEESATTGLIRQNILKQ